MTAPQQSVPSSPQVSQPTFLTDASGAPISGTNALPVSASLTPTANQRVNAQSGDFVAGSVVDLATLLTLAGTPTDANTVASLMGRLTKIRDLLNSLAYDNTNEVKISVYGKATAAGDTPLLLDSSGRAIIGNVVQIGGQAVKLDNTNEQAVSIYGKNAAAGDTPILLDASGRVIVNAAQIGGQAPTLDNTTVLAVSMRGKNSTAGDTALLVNSDGSLQNDLRKVAGNAIATGNNAVPVLNSAATGYVSAYGSNAAALTANTDYLFKWGAGGTTQVNHIMIQNNSSINIQWDLDTATSAGSPVLSNTLGQNTIFLDVQTTAVHIQGNGTPNVNGTSASNIVVRGWL